MPEPDLAHPAMREKLRAILRTDYVALLGQRDTHLSTIVDACIRHQPPLSDMQFISVALPNIADKTGFEQVLLQRLLAACVRVPPASLEAGVQQAVQQAGNDPGVRIRVAFDTLGRGTSLKHLVVVLHALANIPEAPLKDLLLMLREYHEQRNDQGAAGGQLRFLVVGGERLWKLCYHRNPAYSPFEIAQRLLLEGLSVEELRSIDPSTDLSTIIQLHTMTGGVPSLVKEALQSHDQDEGDLSSSFAHLQGPWNALSAQAQQALIAFVGAPGQFPVCYTDYNCPQVPVTKPVQQVLQEAFWAGFLKLQYRQLAWRSRVHQLFVLQQAPDAPPSEASAIPRIDLADSTRRLEKALSDTRYSRDRHEPLIEAQSLAVETYNNELVSALEMLRVSGSGQAVLREIEQQAALSEREWLKQLVQAAAQHIGTRDALSTFLLDAVVARANYFRSVQFDVFLCYNEEHQDDIVSVRTIATQLKEKQLVPWWDKWEVPPGRPLLRLVQTQITQIKSAAVFVGRQGISPLQQFLIESLLMQFINRNCPIILVLLADAPENVQLIPPLTSTNMTWVDFREHDPDPLQELIWGITGVRIAIS